MRVLVFCEHHGTGIHPGSLGVLSKAATLGADEVGAVLAGAGVAGLSEEAGRHGATTVHVAEDPALDPPLPQPRVDLLAAAVEAGDYDTVLFANSVLASDVAAGLAARLEAGLNWDLVGLDLEGERLVGRRLAIQDSVLVTVGWRSTVRLALVRAGSFEAIPNGSAAPRVEKLTSVQAAHSGLAHVVAQEPEESTGPSLADAEIIVSGGRGLGGPEHFVLAEELAAALGGAVGATRAVVYAHWYPASAQVGQTGTTVTPKLYVALGISGAVQHKVGMQNSKVIVAVNKDPNAPIFDVADLGVVGDVHEIVPRLTELVRARKSS